MQGRFVMGKEVCCPYIVPERSIHSPKYLFLMNGNTMPKKDEFKEIF